MVLRSVKIIREQFVFEKGLRENKEADCISLGKMVL